MIQYKNITLNEKRTYKTQEFICDNQKIVGHKRSLSDITIKFLNKGSLNIY